MGRYGVCCKAGTAMSLACIGSLALDTTITPAGQARNVPGGSAAYFSLASSVLASTSIISAVGNDFPGSFLKTLEKKLIDTSGVLVDGKAKTMIYHSSFGDDYSDRRSDLTQLNVFESFMPSLSPANRKSRFAYLGTLTPAIQLEALRQFESPKLVVMDTIEYFIRNDEAGVRKVLSEADGAVFNESEARLLQKTGNLVLCGKKILADGPSFCIIKKGEHGSILFRNDGSINPFPAFPMEKIVDPTGAGDAFAGGFMGFLASKAGTSGGNAMLKAMAWGTVMGSVAVESFGTESLESLTLRQANRRYNIYRAMMHYDEQV